MFNNIEVIGTKFTSPNKYGDFYWMSSHDVCTNSLYIFNDNEEHHDTNIIGGGNAIMRQFNKHSKLNPPLSAGIPTGTLKNGGYIKFTPRVKKIIDDAIDEIIELIKTHNYSTIYFSSELDGLIGTGIFNVDLKVVTYITNCIYKLSSKPIKIIKVLPNNNFDCDFDFDDEEENNDENEEIDENDDEEEEVSV
jgi:hypothetical protein